MKTTFRKTPSFTPARTAPVATQTRFAVRPLAYSARTTLVGVQLVVDPRKRPSVATLVGVQRQEGGAVEWLSVPVSARVLAELDVQQWLVAGFAPAANDALG